MKKKTNESTKLLEEMGSLADYKYARIILDDNSFIATRAGLILFSNFLIASGFYFNNLKKRKKVVELDGETIEECEMIFWDEGPSYGLNNVYCLDTIEEFEKPKTPLWQNILGTLFIIILILFFGGAFLRGIYKIYHWIF